MTRTRTDHLDLAIDGAVARIALHSGKANAVGSALIADMHAALDQVGAAPQVAVLAIAGRPGLFCVGADLNEVGAILGGGTPGTGMRDFVTRFQQLNDRIAALPCITLAEIDGPAFGGGLELALACDFRVATPRARFGLPEIGLGLIPAGGGTHRLRRAAGPALARRMILGCETLDAPAALAAGLVDRLLPEEDAAAAFDAHLATLARPPIAAISAAKACLGLAGPEAARHETVVIGDLAEIPDTRRRVSAFLERA